MSTIPPIGFTNSGSICYFSALIQCLLSSTFFVRYVKEECKGDLLFDNFFEELQRRGKFDEYFTTRLLETMPGGKLPNQSSSEYLLLLIERMHMDALFQYAHLVRNTCISCGNISESTDKATLLLLTNNMLEFFEHSETIEGVSCDRCHNKDGIKQDRFLRSIPPVIVVSLNKYFEKTQFYYPP
jgi:ubiquitin C-terminal hydrolase